MASVGRHPAWTPSLETQLSTISPLFNSNTPLFSHWVSEQKSSENQDSKIVASSPSASPRCNFPSLFPKSWKVLAWDSGREACHLQAPEHCQISFPLVPCWEARQWWGVNSWQGGLWVKRHSDLWPQVKPKFRTKHSPEGGVGTPAQKFLPALFRVRGHFQRLCITLLVATKTWEMQEVSADKDNACLVSFSILFFFFGYLEFNRNILLFI